MASTGEPGHASAATAFGYASSGGYFAVSTGVGLTFEQQGATMY